MKNDNPARTVARAADELKTLLDQVSGIRVRSIDHGSHGSGQPVDLLAHIDVLGHSHTLACAVNSRDTSAGARKALDRLCTDTDARKASAMPVLIAPRLSPRTQALCKERKIGFLDFEGNARLVMDDIFIVKRTLARREGHRRTSVTV